VKTQFHSGRIEFAFFPNDSSTYQGSSAYVNRVIVDIRETVECELVIPYISANVWTPTSNRIGVLQINVVDPLVAPSSVSSTVPILIEIAGGDDMEFAIPREFDFSPTMFTPQSGLVKEDTITSMTIGNSAVNANPNMASSLCIGDKVSNFRAYLKRFSHLIPSNLRTDTGGNINQTLYTNKINFFPDVIFVRGATVPTYNWFNSDNYSVLASCYAIVRGGMVVRNVIAKDCFDPVTSKNTIGPTPMMIGNDNDPGYDTLVLNPLIGEVNDPPFSNNAHIVFQDIYTNPVVTIDCPQYSPNYGRCKVDIMHMQGAATTYNYNNTVFSSNSKTKLQFNIPKGLVLLDPRPENYTVHNIFRAMSDDATLSCFISIPPMVTRVTLGTATSSPLY